MLLGAASSTALAVTVFSSALAQEAVNSIEETEAAESIEEVVVFGEIVYKSRTEKVTPVIDYDARYFQRFEPVSVGDAIKRLPGVVFSDEVNEYESVQLRGLGPEFTQVLINDRRVPGGGNNRAFLIDRVPAELIRNVQIVRSPSADMPSEGVAGSVNIELRDPGMLDGGYLRGGLLHYDDGKIRGAGSMAYGASVGDVN
ncbi:MAG: TonB-dependent receptor plug domain-containing protein, partial [Gammaproteobacteria bacterium]|nr:TonB-dependent receptor plug domain-containing protein [Gammaproteobacteria bacterium]